MVKVTLKGYILVPEKDLQEVRRELINHRRLTLDEPGCISFIVTENAENPLRFDVFEEFVDRQAFALHLIMTTRHDATPSDADEQLLVDIDLAILGATPERFAEYDAQVRAEYAWVPGFVYRMKRRSVLKAFLARPRLYGTDHFRARYEAQARRNLAAVL